MHINLIACLGPDNIIGVNGKLPWHWPEDLAEFKRLTKGHAVVTGRKTWESLDCKPLPDRTNIVITRTMTTAAGAYVFPECYAAWKFAKEAGHAELWVIGGVNIYRAFGPYADEFHFSRYNGAVTLAPGDDIVRMPQDVLRWANET